MGKWLNLLPPKVAGHIDLLRPSLWNSWGGPMNGQARRQELMQELVAAIPFALAVETGSYRGTTTGFLHDLVGTVKTVEANARFHTFTRWRFLGTPGVKVHKGDSRQFLLQIAEASDRRCDPTLFYLDAHWENDLPLREEVEIIAKNWRRAVIVIDDFRVPDDSGYGFDDYGPGGTLEASYLPLHDLEGWRVFYPSSPAESETGARRGCCVLASPLLAAVVDDNSLLRRS